MDELRMLKERLNEAEAVLRAIRHGEVDAVIVEGPFGEQVFTLEGENHAYRAFVENMGEGAVTLDKTGLILYANLQTAKLLQVPLHRLIGTDFNLYVASESHDFFRGILNQPQSSTGKGELILNNNGGHVHVLVSINTIRELAEEKLCMILTDLTDQKKLEDQLNQNILRLETANSDLQRFAYVASHDMKEPLRNITSCVQLLHKKMKSEVDAETQTLLGYLVDSNNRIVDLIDDLLRFSRIGTTGQPFKVIDSGLVIHDVMRRLSRLIVESKAEIIFSDLPHVSADWSQLSLVFQNLISNSIKFCSTGKPRIEISAEYENCQWKFMLKDNGIGIEEAYYDKIFEIFQRLNGAKFSGTGIGLAIVKRIVERHGGRIWVKGKVGEGSTFYFTLLDRVPECEDQLEGVAATTIQSDFPVRSSESKKL